MTKTHKKRRFETQVRFVIRKLHGTVGINIEKSDYQKIKLSI